jgi:hypothetical protein
MSSIDPAPNATLSAIGMEHREVAVAVLMDVAPGSRLWGYSRIVRGPAGLRGTPGLRFCKVLGSGHRGGFSVRPSPSHQGLFCVFADDAAAESFIVDSPLMASYRSHARELFSVKLRAISSRGSWSRRELFEWTGPQARVPEGTIAALTRASIRPTKAYAFWRRAPPAEASLARAEGCLLAAGLGEAPFFRQATFTIWTDNDAMDRYARTGAHLAAIRAAREGAYFSEDLFARFVPYDARGTWHGRAVPLATAPLEHAHA